MWLSSKGGKLVFSPQHDRSNPRIKSDSRASLWHGGGILLKILCGGGGGEGEAPSSRSPRLG